MGINISKFTRLISDLCSEISCRSSCCGINGLVLEFDNKDSKHEGTSEHSVSRARHHDLITSYAAI